MPRVSEFNVLLRRAHAYPDPCPFRDPARRKHIHLNLAARGEAMVGRTTVALVVEAIDRHVVRRAGTRGIGQRGKEDIALELPIRVAQRTFATQSARRVEVRAGRRKCHCEKSADGHAASTAGSADVERLSRSRPAGERAVVELGDLVRDCRDEIVIERLMNR